MESSLDKYLREHSTLPSPALEWIQKQTHIRTNFPRMLSGPVQGELLKMLVSLTGAKHILEIGSFTGYSTVCLALGGGEDCIVDALEINDELEELMREGWDKAGVSSRIRLHLGDACETLGRLAGEPGREYDFVFMDANKREYCKYYELLMPLLRPGGLLVADDVLWDGKVYADSVPSDAQTQGLLEFNRRVAEDPGVETVMLPLRDGLLLIRKL